LEILLPIKSNEDISAHTTTKKVSLNTKRNNVKATNSAVLDFMDTSCRKSPNTSIMTGS